MTGTEALPTLPALDVQLPGIDVALGLPALRFLEVPGAPAQWAVGLPLAAAVLGLVLVRRSSRMAAWLAIGAGFLTLIATVGQLWRVLHGIETRTAGTIGALPLGAVEVPLGLYVDRLGALVAVAVALVALVVQVFARWYLWFDPRYRAFAATVSLFTAAMLLVVLSGDLVLTLVGWEVMGWCSFLLIGHLSHKDSAGRAATKAFLVTRVADVAFVIGIVILVVGAGSSSIPSVLEHWAPTGSSGLTHPDQALLTAAMLCLLSGVAGKSAQLPFQDWLPDAMEGPTPASALIHAATMVAAGTFVLARLFPVFAASGPARVTLAVVTALTAVLAALLAFAQLDLKRLLAWSTVSQVSLMLAALTVVPAQDGPDAGVLHLLSHAMFKALLFLGVGWLSVLVGGTLAAHASGATKRFPSLGRPLGIGLLALAGVPPFVGFVSKELILGAAEQGLDTGSAFTGTLVLVAVGATAPLTAAYCMRAWLILSRPRSTAESAPATQPGGVRIDDFFDETQVVQQAIGVEQAESAITGSARLGVQVLAVLSTVGGLLVLTPLLQVEVHLNVQLLGASLLLMAAAAVAVHYTSRGAVHGDAATRLPPAVLAVAQRGLDVDVAYRVLVARPVLRLAHLVSWLDREVIDAYVRGAAGASSLAGLLGDRVHTRKPSPGLVSVLLGMLLVAVTGVVLW